MTLGLELWRRRARLRARRRKPQRVEAWVTAGRRGDAPQPHTRGHVGADAAAVALSEEPNKSEDLVLVVDVGTNAEILLGDKSKVLACSSPTGPAFEGAQISSGQRAAPGAIERIEVDKNTKEPRFRVIGCNL